MENEEQYIIPANTKRSLLIFGYFRPVDLIIFSVGAVFTLFFLFIIKEQEFKYLIVKLSPALVALFLVAPIPNYHNVLVFIQEIINFFANKRVYLWKGWCVIDETRQK